MNTSNNKRYIETEARIHLAFEKLLSVKSFNEITVNNICNEAGISRPSFYAHYEDINDMMNQIELEKSLPIKQMLISADRLTVEVTHHQFNWWFGVGPKKGHITAAPKKAVSQALLLASAKKRIPYYLLSSTLPTALLYIF